jgi:hypothetical protein
VFFARSLHVFMIVLAKDHQNVDKKVVQNQRWPQGTQDLEFCRYFEANF